jgi:hypothetical protein
MELGILGRRYAAHLKASLGLLEARILIEI